MSGPRCNLPPERHEEILAMFSGELSHMNTALHEIGDEEIKGKLLKASVAMLEGFLERVKE